MAIEQFTVIPDPIVSPLTFDDDTTLFFSEWPSRITQINAALAAFNALASGGAVSLQYLFDDATGDADPTAGYLRLSSATQNTSTTIRADLVGSDGSTLTGVLDLLDDSTSTNKGYLRLLKIDDSTKWLLFSVTALASPSGYRNVTVVCVAASTANPFTDGDQLLFDFTPNGDKGETGPQFSIAAAGGTVDVITATYSPAITLADKQLACFVSTGANVSTTPTFAPNALTAHTITARGGAALIPGDIGPAGYIGLIEYNLANTRWELLNPVGGTAGRKNIGTSGDAVPVLNAANSWSGDQTMVGAAFNTARATVASHATTADIWGADGNHIDWTGTATTTAFPAAPQAGVERELHISSNGAAFTAGANMLIDGVTSGNTVTCSANDIMVVRPITTTQFRLTRIKYDGTAQVSAGVNNIVAGRTTSYTLTSTPTLVTTAPTDYNLAITLPNASSLTPVRLLHTVDNTAGSFSLPVTDSAGTLKGFIPAGAICDIGLVVASAAGTWSFSNLLMVGCSEQVATTSITTVVKSIDIGSGCEVVLGYNSTGLYCMVRDNINKASSAITLIRTANVASFVDGISIGSNKILVVSCNQTTGYEAVVVTLSGTSTPTIGTPETKTLSETIGSFAYGALKDVSGTYSFVYCVGNSSPYTYQIRGITVSGTTPTTSNATVFGSTNNSANRDTVGFCTDAQGSTLVTFVGSHTTPAGTGHIYITPWTFSAGAPVIGTQATITAASNNQGTVQKMLNLDSTHWYVAAVQNTSSYYDTIATLASTTITLQSATTRSLDILDAIKVSSTKVLTVVTGATNLNIATRSGANISLGTTANLAGSSVAPVYVTGSNVVMQLSGTIYTIDCSGASPTLASSWNAPAPGNVSSTASNLIGNRTAEVLYSGTNAYPLNSSSANYVRTNIVNGKPVTVPIPYYVPNASTGRVRGKADSEVWSATASYLTKMECVL